MISTSPVVIKNEEGKYLQFYEQTTHTGSHTKVSWTDDINEASVVYSLPYGLRRDYMACERVPVRVYRKVVPLSEVKSRVFITVE